MFMGSTRTDKIKETLEEIERAVHAKDWTLTREAAVRLKYWQGIEDAAREWPNVHVAMH